MSKLVCSPDVYFTSSSVFIFFSRLAPITNPGLGHLGAMMHLRQHTQFKVSRFIMLLHSVRQANWIQETWDTVYVLSACFLFSDMCYDLIGPQTSVKLVDAKTDIKWDIQYLQYDGVLSLNETSTFCVIKKVFCVTTRQDLQPLPAVWIITKSQSKHENSFYFIKNQNIIHTKLLTLITTNPTAGWFTRHHKTVGDGVIAF